MVFIHLDTKYQSQFGYLSGAKFLNNYATKVGGAIKTFFDYSLLKEKINSPLIFDGNNEENGISTSRPSYYLISCYEIISDNEELTSIDFKKSVQANKAVKIFHLK